MRLLLFVVILLAASLGLFAQEYTLPSFHIEIESVYLQSLWQHSDADIYYPASFITATDTLECEAKFRGGSTLWDPKRSWSVKFDNNNNEFGMEKVFFNGEYGDRSLMRDLLIDRLYEHLGYPAPQVRHVSLIVNGQFYGVFEQVEPVEHDFLVRNGREDGNLYKSFNHGGTMAPLTHCEDYPTVWEKKLGTAGDYSDLQDFFSRVFYYTDEQFASEISSMVNVEDILTYFAVEFTIVAKDNFTKNIFLYNNPDAQLFEIFPWDNDGVLGDYADGTDDEGAYAETELNTLEHQVLFRRIMQTPEYRQYFLNRVQQITGDGFDYLRSVIDSTYTAISHDIYLDEFKGCTNAEFDAERNVLNTFLNQREAALAGFDGMSYIPLSDFAATNPFPSPGNPIVKFRCRSAAAQTVLVVGLPDVQFDTWGGEYTHFIVPLYDDGSHDDGVAGDLIYGGSYDTSGLNPHLVLFSYAGSGSDYPANGMFYMAYERTTSFAFNRLASAMPNQPLSIGNIYRSGTDYFVSIVNNTAQPIDASYLTLEIGSVPYRFLIPEGTTIAANSSVIVTSDTVYGTALFPSLPVVGNLFAPIAIGTTIRLYSPMLTMMTERVCSAFSPISYNECNIVISEVNYNSADTFNPEDWVELYNPQSFAVNLTGWYFRDSEDAHRFDFPSGTTIPAGGYLVLCRYYDIFHAVFPNVSNVLGSFDFGLGGSGELIRLYNPAGTIVDQLTYDDANPWPTGADGGGYTLSLPDPLLDNASGANWIDSYVIGGTPGEVNGIQAPTNLTVQIAGGVLTLSWTPVAGVRSYKVYAATAPDAGFSPLSMSSTEFTTNNGRVFWNYVLTGSEARLFFDVRSVNATYSN
jgi:hypothetical protein